MICGTQEFQLSDKIRIPYCLNLSRYKFFLLIFSYLALFLSFLTFSLHCLWGKSLNYSASCRFSLLTYIKPFICTSCIWNKILLIPSGDVELNPGPKKSSALTFFHWNLNETAAHDFAKISLI